jgi:hypothetical protein
MWDCCDIERAATPDRLDRRSDVEIWHDQQRIHGYPPRPAWMLHSVGRPDRHHGAENASPDTRVEHEPVLLLLHARAPRKTALAEHTRPALLGPATGQRTTCVSDGLQPVSRHAQTAAQLTDTPTPAVPRHC